MIHETAEDREHQRWIAGRIAARYNLTMLEMPDLWTYDFVSTATGGGFALWEMKWHTKEWPLFDISARKIAEILDLGRCHGCAVCLGAGYESGRVAWVRIDAGRGYVRELGGRFDRSRCELESMFRIPLDAFTDVP